MKIQLLGVIALDSSIRLFPIFLLIIDIEIVVSAQVICSE